MWGVGVLPVAEVVGVEADGVSFVISDSAVNFDVGVQFEHVGRIKPRVIFRQFDVAVDAVRPQLCHAVDALVSEVFGGIVGDTGERVGQWLSLMWRSSRLDSL